MDIKFILNIIMSCTNDVYFYYVASLPPKEQAMENTWVSSGSISAENV